MFLRDTSLLPGDKARRIIDLLQWHEETPGKDKHIFMGNLEESDRRLLEDFLNKAQVARFVHALERLYEENRDESTTQ